MKPRHDQVTNTGSL